MDYDAQKELDSKANTLDRERLAEEAVNMATRQIMACTEYKKPRMQRLSKYWELYDGKVPKKLRQLFNVPIPVFAGMIDTLNAQYDTPIQLDFKEGDASDYFKVQKIKGAYQMEIVDSSQNSKWDSKLRIARKHAIMNGRAILEYNATSDPEYKSDLSVINLKNFNFQPKGGLYLENHLFAGTEDIDKTRYDLEAGAAAGVYDKNQVKKLIDTAGDSDYLPDNNQEYAERLARFRPLGLDPSNHSYVGQMVFKMASHILEIKGKRYYVCFHPWTKVWVRFEKLSDMSTSELYPWVTYATHEDDENFLSKAYADDLYPSADAIVSLFNQELTNREKRNFGARAYDKDMFTDVRKLDEAMFRPDALVPADTKGGTRRISEGVFEFKTGELQGTVNLIDWMTSTLGRNTGVTDIEQGTSIDVSKKATVALAEQKAVSKRLGYGSQPFQTMMADLGKRYIYGLKDHMPSSMAIRVLGAQGWDWDEITRLDLDTEKDVDILIISSDQKVMDSEIKAKRRVEALAMVDPMTVNPQWRTEEVLRSIGEYSDEEIADALDVQTYTDRKAIARASVSIQKILIGESPDIWYGANIAFIEKIKDYASDRRSTLGDKFFTLMDYAMQHMEIAKENIEKEALQKNVPQPAQSMGNVPQEQEMTPQVTDSMQAPLQTASV